MVEELLGNKSQLNNLINKETLNLDNEEDLYYIMKIITIMTRTEAIEVISKKETKDQGTEDLKRELEILKRGNRVRTGSVFPERYKSDKIGSIRIFSV